LAAEPGIPALRLSDMRFRWPGRSGFSLDVRNFEVAAGEKLFLHGASGSGKSTLLSVICGIAEPETGEVEVNGQNIFRLSASKRDQFRADNIGVIFQMFNLLPFASGLDNILVPLAFSPIRRGRLQDPKTEALRLTADLGLDHDLVINARASELSIGQQQRIAAARDLIGAPDILIADEPTSALDEDAQSDFINLLMWHAKTANATLIMVSHDKRLARHFDRSLGLHDILATRVASP
jgi:putative ABC transport system ATP-binding protein